MGGKTASGTPATVVCRGNEAFFQQCGGIATFLVAMVVVVVVILLLLVLLVEVVVVAVVSLLL